MGFVRMSQDEPLVIFVLKQISSLCEPIIRKMIILHIGVQGEPCYAALSKEPFPHKLRRTRYGIPHQLHYNWAMACAGDEICPTVIIIFDHLLTLGDEVELIWQSPWSLGKVLFILNRYYCLAAVIFNNYAFFATTLTDSLAPTSHRAGLTSRKLNYSCRSFFDWQGWTGLIACMLAEGILQMRLYALYSLNKKVLAIMLSSFVVSTAVAAWIMHSALNTIVAKAIFLPGGAGMFCVPSNVPKNFYTFWIPMLAFECLLCVLALIRGFQTFRSNGSLFQSGRKLVGVLIRDSIFYFLIICATYLTCLLVWIAAPGTLLEVPIGFSLAMSCVLSNRIVLNVRKVSQEINASKESLNKPVSIRMAEVSTTGAESFCTPNSVSSQDLERFRSLRVGR
ncbi:hypothetical protein BJ165DRAFT_1406462 [Panaeolus papilionaceus]|nr:hypothetical protein BJ165DRAFT_1406462 [Panaeolus papilionaceus]